MQGGKGSCLQKVVLCSPFVTSGPSPGPLAHSSYQELANKSPCPLLLD